mmetsp:Transcript_3882/g.8991  ORF Transcript_3882/g.8991 Transcript_3882/m.8991 type:complete len:440 (-) Transcript_3882:726-2045(-)
MLCLPRLDQKGPRLAGPTVQEQRVVGRFPLAGNNLDDLVPYHAPQHGTNRSHLCHAGGNQVLEFLFRQRDPFFLQKGRDRFLGLAFRVAAVVVPQPLAGLFLVFHQRTVHHPRRRWALFVKPVGGLVQRHGDHVGNRNVVLEGDRIQQLLSLFRPIPKIVLAPGSEIDHRRSPHPEAIDRVKDASLRRELRDPNRLLQGNLRGHHHGVVPEIISGQLGDGFFEYGTGSQERVQFLDERPNGVCDRIVLDSLCAVILIVIVILIVVIVIVAAAGMREEARRRFQLVGRTGIAELRPDSRQAQVFQHLRGAPRHVEIEDLRILHLLLRLGTPQADLPIVDVRFRRCRFGSGGLGRRTGFGRVGNSRCRFRCVGFRCHCWLDRVVRCGAVRCGAIQCFRGIESLSASRASGRCWSGSLLAQTREEGFDLYISGQGRKEIHCL